MGMTTNHGHPQKGASVRLAVDAASTANVADLTACSTTMDGVTLVEGNLVLLKDQSDTSENGIYSVGEVASAAAPLTRHMSLNKSFMALTGMKVFVKTGTVSAAQEYVLTTTGTITLGTTGMAFTNPLDSLDTRLSGDESVGELSSASVYTSLTTRLSTAEDTASTNLSTEVADVASVDLRLSTLDSQITSIDA